MKNVPENSCRNYQESRVWRKFLLEKRTHNLMSILVTKSELCPFFLFQVHGHHPSPPAPAVSHSYQAGHLCHLGPGSPAGLPPGLLLHHGDHAQQSGVHDWLARASQQDVWESVSRDDSPVPALPFLVSSFFPHSLSINQDSMCPSYQGTIMSQILFLALKESLKKLINQTCILF